MLVGYSEKLIFSTLDQFVHQIYPLLRSVYSFKVNNLIDNSLLVEKKECHPTDVYSSELINQRKSENELSNTFSNGFKNNKLMR